MSTPVDRDLTPVLPRRFRSFFLLLAGLLGLTLYAVIQTGPALFLMTPFAAEVQQLVMPYLVWPSGEAAQALLTFTLTPEVADAAMMALLLYCGAVVIVRDGSARLSSVVGLAVVALLLALPLYGHRLSANALTLASACMLVPVFAVPGMLKAGPASTALRRLTFGLGLALLLAVALLVVERLVMVALEAYAEEALAWRPYVAMVVALPVFVRLLVKAGRETLPDADDLTDVEDVRPSVSSGGPSTTRPVAVLLLIVGVLMAFCMPIEDMVMSDSRRWAAVAVLLLFLVCYARSILVIAMSWRFWVCGALLCLMPVWCLFGVATGASGECASQTPEPASVVRWFPLMIPVVSATLGCLAASYLMRFFKPRHVIVVCVVLAAILLAVEYAVLYIAIGESLRAGGLDQLSGIPCPSVSRLELGICSIMAWVGSALMAAASCGLYAYGLRGFSVREGSLAFGLMCAAIPAFYLLNFLVARLCATPL